MAQTKLLGDAYERGRVRVASIYDLNIFKLFCCSDRENLEGGASQIIVLRRLYDTVVLLRRYDGVLWAQKKEGGAEARIA